MGATECTSGHREGYDVPVWMMLHSGDTPVAGRAAIRGAVLATPGRPGAPVAHLRSILQFLSCVVLAAGVAHASEESSPPPPETEEPAATETAEEESSAEKWYDRVQFRGDFRLRYEGFNWRDHFDDGRRDRFRYRLRFGFQGQVLNNLALGFQLRSGNPNNPASDNQSFDEGFGKTPISLAEAWVDWKPASWLEVVAGKFPPTRLWTAADLEWDDDVTAEGAMQLFSWKRQGLLQRVNVNLYQFVLNESGDSVDAYMLGGQVVPVFRLGARNELATGITYETVSDPEAVAELYFDGDLVIDSGYVTNLVDPNTGRMVSDFQVGSAFLTWANTSLQGWPVKASVFFYKNFGAGDGVGAILPVDGGPLLSLGRGTSNDTAWFARVQVGGYERPGQLSFRLSRYDSRPDALFFAYTQSDTRRGSNVDGYRGDVRIGMPKRSYINLSFYRTNWAVGDDTTMYRWQLDYVFTY